MTIKANVAEFLRKTSDNLEKDFEQKKSPERQKLELEIKLLRKRLGENPDIELKGSMRELKKMKTQLDILSLERSLK